MPIEDAHQSRTAAAQRRLAATLREALDSAERYIQSGNPEDLERAFELHEMARPLFEALRTG